MNLSRYHVGKVLYCAGMTMKCKKVVCRVVLIGEENGRPITLSQGVRVLSDWDRLFADQGSVVL